MTNEAEIRKNLEVMFEVLQETPSVENEQLFLAVLSDYRVVHTQSKEIQSETKTFLSQT